MRDAVASAGGNADALQVAGNLPVVRRDDRSIDPEPTMANVPQLVAAGVTDFRVFVMVPETFDEALASLSPIVEAFQVSVH
jgi:hypothetical protein